MSSNEKEEKVSSDKLKIETPIEQSQPITAQDLKLTEEIKEKFGDRLNGLYDDVIIRFVRGYAHEQERKEQTFSRIKHYLDIRDQYNFDKILDEPFEKEQECFDAWPIFSYGEDKQGHPILYDEVGSVNIPKIESAFGGDLEKIKKYRYRFMKRLANKKKNQSEKYNVRIYKHIMVMDVGGFSLRHFAPPYVNLIRDAIGEEQHLFPETLYKLYIINAPWAFRTIWKILKNFIDPITVQKIQVLSDSYLQELIKEVHKDEIPKKYGGNAKWGDIQLGQCIPHHPSHYPSHHHHHSHHSHHSHHDQNELNKNNQQ